MDKKFIKLINILVEKKVRQILPSLLDAELERMLSSGDSNTDVDIASLTQLKPQATVKLAPKVKQFANPTVQVENKIQKKWTNNPALNKILNDTVNTAVVSGKKLVADENYDLSDYKSILSEEYSGGNTQKAPLATTTNKNVANKSDVISAVKQSVINRGASEKIANVLIKDYSGVMKAIDAKKANKNSVNAFSMPVMPIDTTTSGNGE